MPVSTGAFRASPFLPKGGQFDERGHPYLGREVEEIQSHWQYLVDDMFAYEERFDIAREDRKIPKRHPWEK